VYGGSAALREEFLSVLVGKKGKSCTLKERIVCPHTTLILPVSHLKEILRFES
jgi:hypothetical protein